jgi:hypothetical protein
MGPRSLPAIFASLLIVFLFIVIVVGVVMLIDLEMQGRKERRRYGMPLSPAEMKKLTGIQKSVAEEYLKFATEPLTPSLLEKLVAEYDEEERNNRFLDKQRNAIGVNGSDN